MKPTVAGQQRELSALICEQPRSYVTRMMFDPLPSRGQLWCMWPSHVRWRGFARGATTMPRVGE
jgi:hypothetical protein